MQPWRDMLLVVRTLVVRALVVEDLTVVGLLVTTVLAIDVLSGGVGAVGESSQAAARMVAKPATVPRITTADLERKVVADGLPNGWFAA